MKITGIYVINPVNYWPLYNFAFNSDNFCEVEVKNVVSFS